MGNKPKLLYASPFPPLKSGISDYSVALVKALEKEFDITLYTDNYEVTDEALKDYPKLKYWVDDIDFDSFDYRIYNIGNQPGFHSYIYDAAITHPGMIIMHDFMLYFLFVGYYLKKDDLYSQTYHKEGLESFLEIKRAVKSHGTDLLEQKEMASTLALNRELISAGNKIMVHSEYSRNKILETGLIKEEDIRKINHLSLMSEDETFLEKERLFAKYNIPTDAFIVASFGYIAETKLNREVCEAVKKLAASGVGKICYVMAGDGEYVDDELQRDVVIKTGYTNLDDFNSFIKHSDIIVNLRNPSMGETSGAMIRILQTGKVCITNSGGWFSELPDDCVVKIGLDNVVDNLTETIKDFIEHPEKKTEMEKNATDYIKREYSPEVIVEKIKEFI